MLLPKRLHKGDTIGIISLSRELKSEYKPLFENAVSEVEKKLDLKVKIGKNVWNKNVYSAGTAQEKVDDLHGMFLDKDIKAIISSIGGKMAIEMLELIDWEIVRNNPKIFIGISDASTLMYPLFAKCKLASYYGCEFIKVWGRGISDYELSSIKAVLFGDGDVNETIYPNENRESVWGDLDEKRLKNLKWEVFRAGKAKGKLLGGAITMTFNLWDTEYIPDFSDAIVFLESYSGNSEKLHQQFESLKLKGLFNKINGLILGFQREHFVKEEEERERDLKDIVIEVTKDYDFPIVYIPDIGHCIRNILMPIGVNMTLDTTADRMLKFDERPVA